MKLIEKINKYKNIIKFASDLIHDVLGEFSDKIMHEPGFRGMFDEVNAIYESIKYIKFFLISRSNDISNLLSMVVDDFDRDDAFEVAENCRGSISGDIDILSDDFKEHFTKIVNEFQLTSNEEQFKDSLVSFNDWFWNDRLIKENKIISKFIISKVRNNIIDYND
jgi:hypothetical protein